MKFVVFVEENHKENIEVAFFLQYDGNEEALNQLTQLVDDSGRYWLGGDFSSFCMSMTPRKISQTTIDEMKKALTGVGGYTYPVNFCVGKFTPPFNEETLEELESSEDIATKLDEWFYACRIDEYFK